MAAAFIKSIGIWLIIVLAAILNGFIREKALMPIFGIQASLPLSGITLSLLILIIAYFLVPLIGKHHGRVFFFIGVLWVGLTLAFEYLFGHFVLGKSWAEINDVFNLKDGNLFVVAVFISAAAPWLVAKLRGIL
jgi:hypothetical protein